MHHMPLKRQRVTFFPAARFRLSKVLITLVATHLLDSGALFW